MADKRTGGNSGRPLLAGGEGRPEYKLDNPAGRVLLTKDLRNGELLRFVIFNTGDCSASKARKYLGGCLPREAYAAIQKVETVSHTSGCPRIDLWLRRELGDGLKRSVLEAFRDGKTPKARAVFKRFLDDGDQAKPLPWWWRIDVYRSWRDRQTLPPRVEKEPRDVCNSIMTWNVNGYHSKSLVIEEALQVQKVAVCALQETLVSENARPIRPSGYTVYCAPWEEGFRGQAVLVDNRLPSYRIPHDEPWLLHVKISHWPFADADSRIMHVFGVYFPSGGNFRGQRRKKVRKLVDITNEIVRKSPKDMIVVLGDWNFKFQDVQRRLKMAHSEMTAIETVGSNFSRFPAHGKASGLDHYASTPQTQRWFRRPRVLRSYTVSDHRPVLLLSRKLVGDATEQEKRYGYNKQMVNRCRSKLVVSNRWEAISRRVEMGEVEDNPEPYLNTATTAFNKTFDDICREMGIKEEISDSKPERKLPRSLKAKLTRLKATASSYAEAVDRRNSNVDRMRVLMMRAKKGFKKAHSQWQAKQRAREYAQIAESMAAFDMKSSWQRIRSKSNLLNTTGEGQPMKSSQPLRDSTGHLHTDAQGIRKVLKEHYQTLLQDVPDEAWKTSEFWKRRCIIWPEAPTVVGINDDLVWKEVLKSIREMNGGTSPGIDGPHIDVFKGLLAEECMAEIKYRNPSFVRRDNVQVHLPEDKLPAEPRTNMGKAAFDILQSAWRHGLIPGAWDENVIISLFKRGDPEQTNNYRGITLISVLEKILTGVMMRRLYAAAEQGNWLTHAQGGFRTGEEAIGQVVSLAEIVRRCVLDKKSAFGVFIDFKKAYDKVPHELMWAILENSGVKGRMLDMIKSIYHATRVAVRAAGGRSSTFELWRGLRQGCLLSPLLFAIFIGTMFPWMEARRRGNAKAELRVPGVQLSSKKDTGGTRWPESLGGGRIEGLLYADDGLGLEEGLAQMDELLQLLFEWGDNFGMEFGIEKCGVMLWSENKQLRKLYDDHVFTAIEGRWPDHCQVTIPKVDHYKYLGVVVDEALHKTRDTDTPSSENTEMKHAKSLATKGRKALHAIRPVIIDRFCPLPLKVAVIRTFIVSRMLYGGELLGFRQDFTKPPQQVLAAATKWAVGLRGTSKEVGDLALGYELSLPTIEEEFSAARTRLWAKAKRKADGGKTYLPLLARWRGTSAKQTWTTGSQKLIKTLLPSISDDEILDQVNNPVNIVDDRYPEDIPDVAAHTLLPEWVIRGRMYEAHVRSNNYVSFPIEAARVAMLGQTGSTRGGSTTDRATVARDVFNKELDAGLEWTSLLDATKKPKLRQWEWELVRSVRDAVLARQMKNDRSKSWEWYHKWGFGMTRGYIRSSLQRPDLREGVRWLVAIRTHWFPTTERRWNAVTAKGEIPTFQKGHCPLCGDAVTPGWEWAHLLVSCRHATVRRARKKHLKGCIKGITREVADIDGIEDEFVGISGLNNGTSQAGAVAIILAGGTVQKQYGCSYTFGFGQCELLPVGERTFGFIYTALFLVEVAELYAKELGLSPYMGLEDAMQLRPQDVADSPNED